MGAGEFIPYNHAIVKIVDGSVRVIEGKFYAVILNDAYSCKTKLHRTYSDIKPYTSSGLAVAHFRVPQMTISWNGDAVCVGCAEQLDIGSGNINDCAYVVIACGDYLSPSDSDVLISVSEIGTELDALDSDEQLAYSQVRVDLSMLICVGYVGRHPQQPGNMQRVTTDRDGVFLTTDDGDYLSVSAPEDSTSETGMITSDDGVTVLYSDAGDVLYVKEAEGAAELNILSADNSDAALLTDNEQVLEAA